MWTSLELAKLFVSCLTPLAVLGLGVLVSRSARRIEDRQWIDRRIIEQRTVVYDKMAPKLNDILCFFTRRGHFREIPPPRVLALKRLLDQKFHVSKYLMSEDTTKAYESFMALCFLTEQGPNTRAALRASLTRQRKERGEWREEWDEFFVESRSSERPVKPADVAKGYDDLLAAFSRDLGILPVAPKLSQGV